MSAPELDGPLRDVELQDIVLGDHRGGPEAVLARLDHYAVATGLSHEPGLRYGTQADGPASAIDRLAAREIMQTMGRVAPALLWQRRAVIRARAEARLAAAQGVPAQVRSDRGADEVALLRSETTHEGFFLTRTMALRHPRFDGTQSDTVQREVFIATDAALVLPYDPRRDRVLLVEQFRMGPFGRGDPRPWMLEPIAGRVDAGEAPEDTARREALEEAGLTLAGLEHIASHYCSPGCSTEYFHLYLGLADLPDLAQGHGGLATEQEDIRTHVLSFDAVMHLLETGEADNGPLILSLLWLARARARLRKVAGG